MRTLLVIVAMLGIALNTAANAQSERRAYGTSQRYYHERAVCEERAEAEDRTGQFRGYPCWAREAFARGRNGPAR